MLFDSGSSWTFRFEVVVIAHHGRGAVVQNASIVSLFSVRGCQHRRPGAGLIFVEFVKALRLGFELCGHFEVKI